MVVPVSAPGFARADGRAPVVVIGIGNEFRRDDGAGPAVVARLRDLAPPGVRLVITDGEPTRLLEAWTGAALAVVVDAVRAGPSRRGPGRSIVSWSTAAGRNGRAASSHGLGLDDAVCAGHGPGPDAQPGLIVHAIEAADLSQGTGLTPPVAAAVGAVATAVLDDLGPYRRTVAPCPRAGRLR